MCQSGGVWGWITKLCEARWHLRSRWGSAQTSQITNGNLQSEPFYTKIVFWIHHQQKLICFSYVVFGSQSVASDMRFELFAQNDVKQNTKRQRVINSRYREDYIEPVIYRAIMEWHPLPSPPHQLTTETWSPRSSLAVLIAATILSLLFLLLLPWAVRLHIYKLRLGL